LWWRRRGRAQHADTTRAAHGTADDTPTGGASYGNLQAASLGQGASLNGALPFPADNAWNTDVSAAPVDPNSDALIASIGLTRGLHPDFGSGLWDGAPIGIPYVVVGAGQPRVKVTFTDYGDESDPGPTRCRAMRPSRGSAPTAALSVATATCW
jgi:hypothetical protein